MGRPTPLSWKWIKGSPLPTPRMKIRVERIGQLRHHHDQQHYVCFACPARGIPQGDDGNHPLSAGLVILMLCSGGGPVQCDQFICHVVPFVGTCLQGMEGLPNVKRCGEPRPSPARLFNSYTRIFLACELVCCRHVPQDPLRLIPYRLCSVTWTCHRRRFAY